MLKIAVAGCTGRMGLSLVRLLGSWKTSSICSGSVLPGAALAEAKAELAKVGAEQLPLTTDPETLMASADAVIDFTSPENSLRLAELAARAGKIHVIGTTGFSAAQLEQLKAFAKKTRIVQSGNFSLGVNILESVVQKVAAQLGAEYDIEIDEMHHRHKKDAPSGTALMLARAAAQGRGVANDFVLNRDGERTPGTIGISVRRGGDVVGVHHVQFAGPGEMLTFTHEGFSRDIYAHGAIKAAEWAANQPNGLYSMKDVLGL